MYDFLRFIPTNLPDLGFKGYVFFADGCAKLIRASSVSELRSKLRKVREDVMVGVLAEKPEVCREAVMRRKVDVLLDWDGRELDYATLMLAAEKDVTIEFGLSKFLRCSGAARMRLFERLRDEVRVVKKFDTPFIITSAAEDFWEMRSRRQVETFFAFFGCDLEKARFYAERLVRRYYDPNYIMDGFEIEV